MSESNRISHPPTRSSASDADSEIDLGPVRTLIVEDDPRASQLIEDIARQHGHQLTIHAAAEHAVREWDSTQSSAPFDLIIVDLALPGQIDGFDFLRWVRRKPSNNSAAILVITGNRAIADIGDLLRAGTDDYLAKPFDALALDIRLTVAEHRIATSRARHRAEIRAAENEGRFRYTFDQCPDALLVVSSDDGRILEANRSVRSLLGHHPEEVRGEFLSLVLPDLFETDDPRISDEIFTRPVTLHDIRHIAPDGTIRFLDVTVAGIQWGDNTQIFLSFRDATERRELESQRLLTSKSQSASLLASGVAHDFNNLLTAIEGNLSLLSIQRELPPDALELVGNVRDSCRTAGALATQLMNLGRPPKSAPRPLDIRPLIEKSVQFALYRRHSKPEFTFADGLWKAIADESQLIQIITNLAINADQAMPAGGSVKITAENSTIRPGTSATLDPGNYVTITVADSGIGIPAENLPRVFDPYFTTKQEGTGLGLATVAALLYDAGGRIKVESAPGAGTTFSLFIPASTSARTAGAAEDSSDPFSEPRVLFMDDDPGIRRVVEKMLTKAGFDVYCASDGAEAIEVYSQSIDFDSPFDVLLLDLDVRGGIGGVEAIRRIREKFPQVRALVTSGYVDDAVLENHQEFGFSGVITKPFNTEKLVSALQALIRKKPLPVQPA